MWAATFSNGGVDEKDKSLKVAEKRLQLVIGFTCVVIVLFELLLCVIF